MSVSNHANPVLLDDGGKTTVLTRIRAHDLGRDEDWLQERLFLTPALVPAGEVDPTYGRLAAVAREIPTDCGAIDLLYVNPAGYLTVVETKLWKNPEARRKVVAQIIDYASEMARWSYDDLRDRVQQANRSSADPILAAARSAAGGALDEEDFKESVSRHLASSRFLLLIIGDDTHDAVGRMVEFFQTVPQNGFTLNFTVALIEMALYRLGSDTSTPVLFQPRVVARTREIVRAVIQVNTALAGPATVTMGEDTPRPVPTADQCLPRATQSFWSEQLKDAVGVDVAIAAEQALVGAAERGLEVDYKTGGPCLKWTDEVSGSTFNFGQFGRNGTFGSTGRLSWKCVGHPVPLPRNIWTDYYDALVKLIPGSARCADRDKNVGEFERVIGPDGDDPPLAPLLEQRHAWLEATMTAVERIQAALTERQKCESGR